MTHDEVVELLTFAQAIDRRNVGDAEIAAWLAILADTDPVDAGLAVRKHFQTSTDWLMPAHIAKGVRDLEVARMDAFGPIYPDPAIMEMHHLSDEEGLRMEMRSRRERLALVKRGLLVRGPGGREVRLDTAALEA